MNWSHIDEIEADPDQSAEHIYFQILHGFGHQIIEKRPNQSGRGWKATPSSFSLAILQRIELYNLATTIYPVEYRSRPAFNALLPPQATKDLFYLCVL
jgi:hypothetical protein